MATDTPTFFFSYARCDGEFVLRLATDLRAGGARVWVDQLDISGGQRWDVAIEAALRTCRGMVVILSPEAVASNNVLDEVSYALEHDKLIVPVIHRPCEVPYRLRRLQRIDLTSSYQVGLKRLFKALGIAGPSAPITPAMVAPRSNEALGETAAAAKRVSSEHPQAKPKRSQFSGALLGAVAVVALTIATGFVWTGLNYAIPVLAGQACLGAIAGAVVGNSRLRLGRAAIGVGVAFLVAFLFSQAVVDRLALQFLVFLSLGLGAIGGAIAGALAERSRT